MVTHGPGVVGTEVAKEDDRPRVPARQYAGGRHRIRVDMLNKMALTRATENSNFYLNL